jgi:hypothetical protein
MRVANRSYVGVRVTERAGYQPPEQCQKLLADRMRQAVENPENVAFARRILKLRRAGSPPATSSRWRPMAELIATIDARIRDAVTALRERGYSWAEIGSQLGVTCQAAQQRWGNRS